MNTVRRRPVLAFNSGRAQELAARQCVSFNGLAPFTECPAGMNREELALADPRTIVMLASRDISQRCAEVRRIKDNVVKIYAEGKQKLSEIVV
jgi:hypothetical protein